MSETAIPPYRHVWYAGAFIEGKWATSVRTWQIKVCPLHLRCTRHRSRRGGERCPRKHPEADTNTDGEYLRADDPTQAP